MSNPDDTTYIVSGFPRSGTSMMMRMLTFGGLEPIVANKKKAPIAPANPYGTVEIADANDIHFLKTAGRVVKIVAPYIEVLPVDRKMKVIFMIRDLHEIVASLMAQGVIWEFDPIDTIHYAQNFLKHHNIPTHLVQYKEVMKYPRSTAIGIVEFLGIDLNINEMIKAVDPDARHAIKSEEADEYHKYIISMDTPKLKLVEYTELGRQM